MIADYSSYLELLAALYISMLLDVDTLNKLWYPAGYYKKIENTLNTVMPEEEQLNSTIVEESKKNAAYRNRRMRSRALFMLALTAILLILLGIESSFGDNALSSHEPWYNAVMISYLLGTLISFFGGRLFDRWNTTSIMVLFFVVCLIVLLCANVHCQFYGSILELYPIVIVGMVTSPLLSDIVSRWLFSSVYSGYLRNYVQKVKEDYDLAMSSLEKNDKKHIPRVYRRLINDSIYTSNNQKTLSDICIQGYVDIRNRKLEQISTYPNGFDLFVSWAYYHFVCFYERIERVFRRRKDEDNEKPLSLKNKSVDNSRDVVLNYQKEYDEFLVERSKAKHQLNIRQFCQRHGYDASSMIAWLKQSKNNTRN